MKILSVKAMKKIESVNFKNRNSFFFMKKAGEISAKKLAKKIGEELDVIVDEIDEEGAICRTKADAPEIDGNLFIEENFDKIHVGDIVKVNVTASGDYDLWGTISKDQKNLSSLKT